MISTNLSRPQSAFHDVRVLPDPLVVLQEPLQRRLVGVELRLELGLRQEPALPPEEGLREAGAVEVEGDTRARPGDAEAERRRVHREVVRGELVLGEEVLPLGQVVVTEEVKCLCGFQRSYGK